MLTARWILGQGTHGVAKAVVVFLLPLCMGATGGENGAVRCAVLDLLPRGSISTAAAAAAGDRLGEILGREGDLSIVSPKDIRKKLGRRQDAKKTIADLDGAILAGRQLNVTRVVFGTVGRIGTLNTMRTTMVDVGAGAVIGNGVTEQNGPAGDLADAFIQHNARALIKSPPRKPSQPPRPVGALPLVPVEMPACDAPGNVIPGQRWPATYRIIGHDMDPASRLPMLIAHIKTGYRMRLIPAGESLLGNPSADASERPQHRVQFEPFWIGETEATCRQFIWFIGETGTRSAEGEIRIYRTDFMDIQDGRLQEKPGFEDYPAHSITWFGARDFAKWLDASLPTEAQWERAARGGTTTLWSWGDQWNKSAVNTAERAARIAQFANHLQWHAWWRDAGIRMLESHKILSPVKADPPNPFGLYAMHGNVSEWCADWYNPRAYEAIADGQKMPIEPTESPVDVSFYRNITQGTNILACRVLRGGAWYRPGYVSVSHARNWFPPSETGNGIGVRPVVNPLSIGTAH